MGTECLFCYKLELEAVARRYSAEEMFWQNVQENTCAGLSFLISVYEPVNVLKRDFGTGILLYILQNLTGQLFTEHVWTGTCSEHAHSGWVNLFFLKVESLCRYSSI